LSGGSDDGGGGGAIDAAAQDTTQPANDAPANDAPGDDAATGDDTSVPDAGHDSAPPDASTSFFDDFNRADGGTIGNNWLMKYPPAFTLANGSVLRQYPDDGHDFVDNIVYRPVLETALNVEVSIEVKLAADPPGYPQVHARVQPSTVGSAGHLDSYFLYVNNAMSVLQVARQHGDSASYVALATLTVSPPLTVGPVYRLRLDVTGTVPVSLTGIVEKSVNGNWMVLQSAAASDTSAQAITTAGTVGFSGGRPESNGLYSFDNFTRTPL
jgi:hypothetical protein